MAKQKIVVRVTMSSEKKARKAFQIAVSISGDESASFVGSNRDQIEVNGEGIDSVKLTNLLRKKIGYTELVSVGPVGGGRKELKPQSKEPKITTVEVNPYEYYYNTYVMPYYDYYYYPYQSLDIIK